MTKPKNTYPTPTIRNLEDVARVSRRVVDELARDPALPIGYYRAALAAAADRLAEIAPGFKSRNEKHPLPRRSWEDLKFTAQTLHEIAAGALEARGQAADAATEPTTPKPEKPTAWNPEDVGRALAGVFAAYVLASAGPEVLEILEILAGISEGLVQIPSSHYAILEQIPNDGRRAAAIEAWASEFSRLILGY